MLYLKLFSPLKAYNTLRTLSTFSALNAHRHPFLKKTLLLTLLLFLYSSPVAASLSLTGKLNINSATIEELILLPYIGEVRSKAISSHRKRRGEFKKESSLLDVKGIGEKTYKHILPYIKLNGDSNLSIKNDASVIEPGYRESARSEVTLLGNSDLFDV